MTFLSAILALSDGQVNGKGDDSRRLLKMEYIQLSAILDISVKKRGITGQLFWAIKPKSCGLKKLGGLHEMVCYMLWTSESLTTSDSTFVQ